VSSADSLPAFRVWRRALRPPRRVAAQKQGCRTHRRRYRAGDQHQPLIIPYWQL